MRLHLLPVLLSVVSALGAARYRTPIARAQEYLSRQGARLDQKTVRTLAVLRRFYTLDRPLLDALAAAEQRYPEKDRNLTEIEVRALKGWPGINTAAQYCRKYPLPWDFLLRLRALSDSSGGAGITRALFTLAIAEWKDCAQGQGDFAAERKKFALQAVLLVQGEIPAGERWVEAVLALHFAGQGEWITEALLTPLVDAQGADGSWSQNPWATARALWLLLESETRQLSAENLPRLRKKFAAHGDL